MDELLVKVFFSREDEGYIALFVVDDVAPNYWLSAFGETEAEALREMANLVEMLRESQEEAQKEAGC